SQLRGDQPAEIAVVKQAGQLKNPDCMFTFDDRSGSDLLDVYASNHQGLSTGDNPRFRREHWELPACPSVWSFEQSAPNANLPFTGRSGILKWENGRGELYQFGRDNVASLHNVDRRGEE